MSHKNSHIWLDENQDGIRTVQRQKGTIIFREAASVFKKGVIFSGKRIRLAQTTLGIYLGVFFLYVYYLLIIKTNLNGKQKSV